MRWSSSVLDKHVAPGISAFTAADIPDLQSDFPEWRHWVTNHFLSNVLRGGFKEPWRQYAVNFIRRSRATFNFYHTAREVTTKYLNGNDVLNPKVGQYYEAYRFGLPHRGSDRSPMNSPTWSKPTLFVTLPNFRRITGCPNLPRSWD